jgi:hypothetical protein
MKVKLDNIERTERERKSDGSKFTSVLITVNGKKMSGIEDDINSAWVIGDEVDIETYERNGFTNFTTGVSIGGKIKEEKQLDRIEEKVNQLIKLFEHNRMFIESKDNTYPNPSLNEARAMVKDIPASEMKKGDIDPRFVTEEHINPEDVPF